MDTNLYKIAHLTDGMSRDIRTLATQLPEHNKNAADTLTHMSGKLDSIMRTTSNMEQTLKNQEELLRTQTYGQRCDECKGVGTVQQNIYCVTCKYSGKINRGMKTISCECCGRIGSEEIVLQYNRDEQWIQDYNYTHYSTHADKYTKAEQLWSSCKCVIDSLLRTQMKKFDYPLSDIYVNLRRRENEGIAYDCTLKGQIVGCKLYYCNASDRLFHLFDTCWVRVPCSPCYVRYVKIDGCTMPVDPVALYASNSTPAENKIEIRIGCDVPAHYGKVTYRCKKHITQGPDTIECHKCHGRGIERVIDVNCGYCGGSGRIKH